MKGLQRTALFGGVDVQQTREEVRAYTARRVSELLPEYFPDRHLEVVHDGNLFKITGDLSL